MKLLTFILLLMGNWLIGGCHSNTAKTTDFTQKVYTPKYATGFEIVGASDYASTLIRVRNPWQGASQVEMEYFISREGEKAPRDFKGVVIPANAQRIVCMSSSYIAMLDAIDQIDRVVGVSGIHFITNPRIQARKASIKDMGVEMNYELLVGLNPDLVLLYGIGDAQSTVTDKLQELNIPYMYIGEYLEESPLGKAEWMVAIAELTENRTRGIQTFREIPKRYHSIRQRVANVTKRPVVMLNTPWNDNWSMPSTKSYVARLIADAGGSYIYTCNTSNQPEYIGLETAYKLLQEADVWINTGRITSLEELKTIDTRFFDTRVVQNRQVYNNNLRLNAGGGNDYWETGSMQPDIVLRDLIKLLHPELVPEPFHYYRQLK